MLRIIQPAGFSKAPLVRIGLLEDVEEVILLCSPESMNDEEFERIQSVAKELGSKAKYTREIIPIIGVAVPEILKRLTLIKKKNSHKKNSAKIQPTNIVTLLINMIKKVFTKKNKSLEKRTLVSTNSSTLLFGNCVLEVFPECETITMNRTDSTYFLSSGITKEMTPLPKGIDWKLNGLRHELVDGKHKLYAGEKLIATPSTVSLKRGKIFCEWENNSNHDFTKEGRKKDAKRRKLRAKLIAQEQGMLIRMNSETSYIFSVPQNDFDDFDRYTIDTDRSIRRGSRSLAKSVENNFFSSLQMPSIPHGKSKSNGLCLHVILNNDITTTALSIMFHEPDFVVLWALENDESDQSRIELEGRIALMISYLSGKVTTDLEWLFKHPDIPSCASYIQQNPPPKLDIEFHLLRLSNLSQDVISLPKIPPVEKTIVEINSGFLGFQVKMFQTLVDSKIDFNKWFTNPITFESSQISSKPLVKRKPYPNISQIILRKRIPYQGAIISIEENYLKKLKIVLSIILENVSYWNDLVIPSVGSFSDIAGNKIYVKGSGTEKGMKLKPPRNSCFEINLNNEKFWTLGIVKGIGVNDSGDWLEQISAHMIHVFWNSIFSVIGFKSRLISGIQTLGGEDEIDIISVTADGSVVIGETKAIAGIRIDNALIGQLSGEVSVLGKRGGTIPMIVLASDSQKWDSLAKEKNIIICSWWELQYPERIMHRFKTGKRSEEELAEIADLNAKSAAADKEEAEKKAKKEAEKKFKRPDFVHPLFWKYMPDQASFLEKPIEEQKRLSNENKEEHRKKKTVSPKVQQNTLFAGTVNLEQFALLDDGRKNTISISGVEELKETVIAIAKRKYKTLFGEDSNTVQTRKEASGYDIRVVDISQKPENMATAENAKAYLFNCDPILSKNEKEDS